MKGNIWIVEYVLSLWMIGFASVIHNYLVFTIHWDWRLSKVNNIWWHISVTVLIIRQRAFSFPKHSRSSFSLLCFRGPHNHWRLTRRNIRKFNIWVKHCRWDTSLHGIVYLFFTCVLEVLPNSFVSLVCFLVSK